MATWSCCSRVYWVVYNLFSKQKKGFKHFSGCCRGLEGKNEATSTSGNENVRHSTTAQHHTAAYPSEDTAQGGRKPLQAIPHNRAAGQAVGQLQPGPNEAPGDNIGLSDQAPNTQQQQEPTQGTIQHQRGKAPPQPTKRHRHTSTAQHTTAPGAPQKTAQEQTTQHTASGTAEQHRIAPKDRGTTEAPQ